MTAYGTRVDEIGTLIRDGGAFYLRRDLGGRYELELYRTPVDLVEKRVRLAGVLVGPDLVNADGVVSAWAAKIVLPALSHSTSLTIQSDS